MITIETFWIASAVVGSVIALLLYLFLDDPNQDIAEWVWIGGLFGPLTWMFIGLALMAFVFEQSLIGLRSLAQRLKRALTKK